MNAFSSWELERRAGRAGGFLALTFLVLAGAFFRAQIVRHEQFRLTSKSNRLRGISVEAPRGPIFDRNNQPIAVNIPGYSVKVLAFDSLTLRTVLTRLAALVPEDSIDIEPVIRRWKASKYEPAQVFASGETRVIATLEEHRAALPGLLIQAEPRRLYPDSTAVAHLVGYVGQVSQAELDAKKFSDAKPGDIVGKMGLEVEYDSVLRGHNGLRYVEVTSTGRMVREQSGGGAIAPVAGRPMTTTIDLGLQRFIDSMWRADLSGKRGAMVAMTPNGEVLAYYSYPDFDPNAFIGRVDPAMYRALSDNPDKPMYNRVIQGYYPPASPFKLAIAAVALKRGLVTMDSRMRDACAGSYHFGNGVWKCWKKEGHGSLTLRQAIATSCDVYFYQLGLLIGADTLIKELNLMGFGAPSGIDLPNEVTSRFPKSVKSYVNSRGVSTWGGGEVLNLSIGQGANAQTLINMVSFYAALAGDGIKRTPFIIPGRVQGPSRDLGLTAEQRLGLREAMLAVVSSGTATAALSGEKGVRELEMAGKTGTGQVAGQQDIAWFMSFAPASDPKIVVGIQVEEGLHGSLVAKYAFRAIARYLTGKALKVESVDSTEDLGPLPGSAGQDTTHLRGGTGGGL
jgi:penicillin-binding protein 2